MSGTSGTPPEQFIGPYAPPKSETAVPLPPSLVRELVRLSGATFLLGFLGIIACLFLSVFLGFVLGSALGAVLCVTLVAAAVHSTLRVDTDPPSSRWRAAAVVSVGVLSMTVGAVGLLVLIVAFLRLLANG